MPAIPMSHVNTATSQQKRLSKIKANVEIKMFINTIIIFLAMSIRAFAFIRSNIGLNDFYGISSYTFNMFSTDFFSLCSPIVLVASSDIVRSAMWSALKFKRFNANTLI
jgi:cation transport ATPase